MSPFSISLMLPMTVLSPVKLLFGPKGSASLPSGLHMAACGLDNKVHVAGKPDQLPSCLLFTHADSES